MKNNITLIASFSNDILKDSNRNILRQQQGGPAFFCGNAFRKANVLYTLITGNNINVEMTVANGSEFGKIPDTISPKKIDISQIDSDYFLYNPIIEEFTLTNFSKYRGRTFLDVQGLVRDGKNSGKKKLWIPKNSLKTSLFCVKATEEEIQYIPLGFIEQQKNKILIVTKGENGSDIYVNGKLYKVLASKLVEKPIDTIGAGDTYIANFLIQYIKSLDPVKSAIFASEKTAQFLSSKNHHIQSL